MENVFLFVLDVIARIFVYGGGLVALGFLVSEMVKFHKAGMQRLAEYSKEMSGR